MHVFIHELLWFISGDTNISYLVKNGVNIWNDWPYQSYLKQTDQEENYPMHSKEWKGKMKEFIEQIKNDNDFAKAITAARAVTSTDIAVDDTHANEGGCSE